MKLRELLEARDRSVTEMRAVADKAEGEQRDLDTDEDRRFGELKGEIATLDRRIGRAQELAEAERAAPGVTVSGRGTDRFEVRARDFSIVKAIAARLGEPVDDAFEREISAELRRRNPGRKFAGIPVPDQVFHVERRALGDTVMLSGPGGAAAPLYPTAHRPDLFIDRLRSALVVERLGATILNDLQGDQDIPKQTGSTTAQWVAEDGALADFALAFDDVTLSPKTVGAITSYSRRTLINASPDIETIVRNDLVAVIAAAIDTAAMIGPGTGNMPLGIVHTPGVAEIDLATTATWPDVLAFPAAVQGQDADIGSLGWAMNAYAASRLRAIPQDTTVGTAGFLMEGPNSLAGYPVAITSALPGTITPPAAATVIFGAWSQLLVGYWSGVDLLVNPYEGAAYARGRVLVRAMRDVDVAVRHPQSFAFGDSFVVVPGTASATSTSGTARETSRRSA